MDAHGQFGRAGENSHVKSAQVNRMTDSQLPSPMLASSCLTVEKEMTQDGLRIPNQEAWKLESCVAVKETRIHAAKVLEE